MFRSVKASKGNINSRSTSSRSFDESWWTGGENVRGSRKCQGAVWAVGEWVGQGRPLLLQVTTPLLNTRPPALDKGLEMQKEKDRSRTNLGGWASLGGHTATNWRKRVEAIFSFSTHESPSVTSFPFPFSR